MTYNAPATLSAIELRDRLKARVERAGNTEDLDIDAVLQYLMSLTDAEHTTVSVDALLLLANNLHYEARSAESLQAASHAARLASLFGEKVLLCTARSREALALSDLGRFSEATVALSEAWALARELENKREELRAIGNFGTLCGGMGQLDVAIRYFERARKLANDIGFADGESYALSNLVACAVQLRESAYGLRVISQLQISAPKTRKDMYFSANAHHNLARLRLLIGDVKTARIHAEESARHATTAHMDIMKRPNEALFGLIAVLSGSLEEGLAAVDNALATSKLVDHMEVPEYFGMCIDAYEAAGYSDQALTYLYELVGWKKHSIDADVTPLRDEEFAEYAHLSTQNSFDDGFLARAHELHSAVQQRIERFVEMAINAEISCGHDLYRTFRVAKLARHLAAQIGYSEQRIAEIALGAQLCNIGMIAIPTRVLQKPTSLSCGERQILQDHTQYGAKLLRRSNLQVLKVASVITEQHHERNDGTGYPAGLSGEGIAEEARMVAICDAFDAMTHRSPQRSTPLSVEAALDELKRTAGSQFAPQFVTAFVNLIDRERSRHRDFDSFLAEGGEKSAYVRARARMESFIADG